MTQNKQIQSLQDLLGETIIDIKGLEKDGNEYTFTFSNGKSIHFFHQQECCEMVFIEDINGDPKDLLNSPLTMSEEVSSNATNDDVEIAIKPYIEHIIDHEAYGGTWTFYKFATVNGYVTIRWLGLSNGWYSEKVSWEYK